jgi:hypothetical protein
MDRAEYDRVNVQKYNFVVFFKLPQVQLGQNAIPALPLGGAPITVKSLHWNDGSSFSA